MVTARQLTGVTGLALAASLLIFTQPVAHAQAPARSNGPSASPGPTFTKDVLPILQRSCQNRHRPGTPAPMALITYQDARPWARAMIEGGKGTTSKVLKVQMRPDPLAK